MRTDTMREPTLADAERSGALGGIARAGRPTGAPRPPSGPTASDKSPRSAESAFAEAMNLAGRAMVGLATRTVESVDGEVTLAQHRTLVVLAQQGPRRLADLAKALGVSPSTATRMCDRLVRKDLITRARDDIDRREIDLALTPAGRTLVEAVRRRREQEMTRLFGEIDAEDQRRVIDTLHVVVRAVGDTPETDWSAGWSD